MAEISVIVPIYNTENYLQLCIDSILAQTFVDFDAILADDGAQDGSATITDESAMKNEKIIVIHSKNGGTSVARNNCINFCFACNCSKMLTFLDSDDWIHYQFLEILYNGAIKNMTRVSACKLNWVNERNLVTNDVFHRGSETENLKIDLAFSKGFELNAACGKLYDKSLFKIIRFPKGKYCEDRFTNYKLLCQCENICLFNEKLYYYYQAPNSTMRSNWTPKKLDDFVAMEEQLKFFKSNNYKVAYWATQGDYIIRLYWQYVELQKCAEKYSGYKKWILLELKKRLFFYGRICGFNIKKNTEIYYAAFKYRTKIYLKVRRLAKIVKMKK